MPPAGGNGCEEVPQGGKKMVAEGVQQEEADDRPAGHGRRIGVVHPAGHGRHTWGGRRGDHGRHGGLDRRI